MEHSTGIWERTIQQRAHASVGLQANETRDEGPWCQAAEPRAAKTKSCPGREATRVMVYTHRLCDVHARTQPPHVTLVHAGSVVVAVLPFVAASVATSVAVRVQKPAQVCARAARALDKLLTSGTSACDELEGCGVLEARCDSVR